MRHGQVCVNAQTPTNPAQFAALSPLNNALPRTATPEDRAPFGAFTPQGLDRMLVAASRLTFLGHAEPRKLIWRVIRRRSQPCFDVTVHGVRMRLHPFDSAVERVLLLRPQKYCPGELAFLRQCLASGGTLIDAGANVGAMSLPFAQLTDVEIVAVEPVPTALSRLRFNVAANGFRNMRIEAAALSDKEGFAKFFVHGGNIGFSGVGEAWAAGHEIEVPTLTFAAVLRKHRIKPPYVLKIDVERHEDAVLMPFLQSTPQDRWPRHILIETIGHQGVPACVGLMLAHGYERTFATRQNTGLSLTT